METNPIETEVKFRIAKLSALENKIKALEGKLLHQNVFQRTVRLDTQNESLKERGVFLRVRDGEKKIMTIKSSLSSSDIAFKMKEELEIEVSDVEMAERMLGKLGFTQKWIMEKYRTEYELDGTILALDHLPFGDYLEIEGDKTSIEAIIKILELERQERLTYSYWYLFNDYKRANNIVARDIIFEKNSVSSILETGLEAGSQLVKKILSLFKFKS